MAGTGGDCLVAGEQSEKVTQQAVAAIVGCTQARISQLWEIINFAIGGAKSEIYNRADEAIEPEVEQLVSSVIDAIPMTDLPEALLEIFFEWLEPGQWGQMWRSVSIEQQTKVLSTLFSLLPLKKLGFSA